MLDGFAGLSSSALGDLGCGPTLSDGVSEGDVKIQMSRRPGVQHTQSKVKDWKTLFASTKKDSSDLKFFEPVRINGKITVKPPPEIAQIGCEIWRNCLVGQFIDKKPHFVFLRSMVDRLWGRVEMPKIITTDSGLFMFKFSKPAALEWVLENGQWHVGGKPLILRRWKP